MCGIKYSLEEAFKFCWSSFADEHNTFPKSTRRNVKLNKFAFGTPSEADPGFFLGGGALLRNGVIDW